LNAYQTTKIKYEVTAIPIPHIWFWMNTPIAVPPSAVARRGRTTGRWHGHVRIPEIRRNGFRKISRRLLWAAL
jgi:hypothetical protein